MKGLRSQPVGGEEYVMAEVPALPVYVRIVWPPSLI